MLILSNQEIESLLNIEDYMEVLEAAFQDLDNGMAVTRPRSHTYTPLDQKNRHYMFKSMDGSIPRFGIHALRLSSDVVEEQIVDGMVRRKKIPAAPGARWVGLVMLFDINSGEPLAIMQDGYLQRMRVGATSGLAAKYLSRTESRTVGIYGSGWQAGAQLMALCKVRNIDEIKIYSTNRENREKFAGQMTELLGVNVQTVDNARKAIENVDIVVGATNSLVPVFNGEWLRPGMHVNSINGGELDEMTIRRSDLIAVRAKVKSSHWSPPGFMPKEASKGVTFREEDEQKLVELGRILSGKHPGRTGSEQITLFGGSGTGGSSGLGIQFAAVGFKIYQKAMEKGVGRVIPTDWFLEDVHP